MKPAITDAELELMKVLWAEQPLPAREITRRLEEDQGWHRKTVNTLLARLEKKSAIHGTKRHDGIKVYAPLVLEADYARAATSRFVDRMFGGDIAPLVARFAESGAMDSEQLAELRRLVEDLADD